MSLHAPSVCRIHAPLVQAGLVYTGSIGEFRYRFKTDKDAGLLHAAVYSQLCYELARDVEEQDFPWDEDGVRQLQDWLQRRYEAYCAANS